MGAITNDANETFRDYVVDGIPASGANDPDKADIRALFELIDEEISGGAFGFSTWAEINAFTPPGSQVNTIGYVFGEPSSTHTDPVSLATGVTNQGVYSYRTSPHVGWLRVGDLAAVLAEAWAIRTGSPVSGSDYSAKENAVGTATRGAAGGGSAKDWATYTGGTVDDTEYSAKHYAGAASTDAAAAAVSASDAAASAAAAATTNNAQLDAALRQAIPIEGYAQTSDQILPLILDSEKNIALGWDQVFQIFVGPMAAGMGEAVSQTNFPLATADQVTLQKGGRWNGVFVYGQSLATGSDVQAISAISVAQPYHNLSFTNGPRSDTIPNSWGAVAPSTGAPSGTVGAVALVENTLSPMPDTGLYGGESCCSGMANFAVERAFAESQIDPSDFVIFTSAPGHGGSRMNQLNKGSTWYANFIDHVTKANALANTATTHPLVVHAVVWMQGEQDIGAATSYATYKAALIQLQADIETDVRAITGQTQAVHLLTYQTNTDNTGNPVDKVLPAQIDACDASSKIHFLGPHFHLPMTTNNTGVHMAALGYLLFGRHVGRAVKQLVVENRRPDWMHISAVYAKGQTVYVEYLVPNRPIIFDSGLLTPTQNQGFRITDGTGDLTLSNIRVTERGDTIAIDINRALGASPVMRLGLDYAASGRIAPGNLGNGGYTHNVRDSTRDWTIDPATGTKWFLYHWSPAFSRPITILDPNA